MRPPELDGGDPPTGWVVAVAVVLGISGWGRVGRKGLLTGPN
jgi:hypothetical protein